MSLVELLCVVQMWNAWSGICGTPGAGKVFGRLYKWALKNLNNLVLYMNSIILGMCCHSKILTRFHTFCSAR